MTASNDRILSRMDSCSKVILLMVDDIGSGVIIGRLFTFLPPMRVAQLWPIHDKPKLMESLVNNSAYLAP